MYVMCIAEKFKLGSSEPLNHSQRSFIYLREAARLSNTNITDIVSSLVIATVMRLPNFKFTVLKTRSRGSIPNNP